MEGVEHPRPPRRSFLVHALRCWRTGEGRWLKAWFISGAELAAGLRENRRSLIWMLGPAPGTCSPTEEDLGRLTALSSTLPRGRSPGKLDRRAPTPQR